jgi:Fur family transcriptional regulator, peroxide stress response regulator
MPTESSGPEQALRAAGLRRTQARMQILALLAERHDHPTAEQLAETLRSRGELLGAATLYQNLNKLYENSVIGRIKGTDGLMHFDANTALHHHLICRCCGRIVDAEIGPLPAAMGLPRCPHTRESLQDWGLQDMQVELKGICPDCR